MDGLDPSPNDNPMSAPFGSNGRLSHISPFGKVVVSVGLAFCVYMVVGLVSDYLIGGYYGYTGAEMLGNMEAFLEKHGNNLNFYRLLQSLSSVLIFGLSAVLLSYLFTGRWLGIFDFRKGYKKASLLYVPVIMMLAFPIISLLFFYLSMLPVPEKLKGVEEALELFTTTMLSDERTGIFIFNFIMIAILPAIFEELLFRGVIQKLAGKAFNNPHLGILLSGVIFGFIHGQIFKFLPIAILGIILGYLYWWTRNLWFPILGHFFHNGVQVVVFYLAAKGLVNVDVDSPQVLPPLQSAMFAVLFVGIMYLFYNVNRKTADEPI